MIFSVTRNMIRSMPVVAAVLTVLLGALVLVGWHIRHTGLIQAAPAFVPMPYNTALGFLLAGTGLLALSRSWQRTAAGAGLLILTVGIVTLSEYLLAIDLQIDELFMRHDIQVATSHPGRMAPNTALCFVLTGMALIMAGLKAGDDPAPAWVSTLGSIVMALGMVALSGYLLGIEPAYGWGAGTEMAMHSAAGFMLVGVGLISYAWQESLIRSSDMPRWLSLTVGIFSATVAVVLWQALDAALKEPAAPETAIADYVDEGMLLFGILLSVVLALAIRQTEAARRSLRHSEQLQEMLLEQQQLLVALFDNIHESVVSCDAAGRLVRFNRAARQLHDLPAEPIPPEQWAEHYDLYEADGKTPLAKERIPLFRALQGETVRDAEMMVIPKQGTAHLLVANGQPLRDAAGQISGAVVSMHDITEKKRNEDELLQAYGAIRDAQRASINIMEDLERQKQELERSNREKEVLLREVHHRVKNNMQVIVSLLDLQERQMGGEEAPGMFEEAKNRIQAMSMVHEQLYGSPSMAAIDFEAYVRSLVALLQRQARVGVRCDVQVEGHGISLKMDRAIYCGLILNELLSNAFKHAFVGGQAGVVTIKAGRPDRETIEFSVSDNGVGLAADFSPDRETGFGLRLVHLLAERQLGGRVRIEHLEKGTCIAITLQEAES